MIRIVLLVVCLTFAIQGQGQSVALFDGKSLTGWKVSDTKYSHLWKVADGMIIGGDPINKVPVNSYIITDANYENFEFRCLFKLIGDPAKGMINSGIQYRSVIKNNDMVGYQADIGEGYWGDIYDEHRRGNLVKGQLEGLMPILNSDGWNSYIVRCIGNRHELYINGVKTADYTEKDTTLPRKGIIGVQIHSGGNAQIFLKNIEIEVFP
jgi:hypothetical protein